MRRVHVQRIALGVLLVAGLVGAVSWRLLPDQEGEKEREIRPIAEIGPVPIEAQAPPRSVPVVDRQPGPASAGQPGEMPASVVRALGWLVEAQHENGGWGSGSHANQQDRDAFAVQVDPATTAFAAAALLRAGHTPSSGDYQSAVRRATEYLCHVVEEYSPSGPKITDLTGTQPQAKLGPLVDTLMTTQYLAKVLPTVTPGDSLHARVDGALKKCLQKLQEAQLEDGSWAGGGGWAPVLQSSLGCTALELADAAGQRIDPQKLALARGYQKLNYDAKSGRVNVVAAAGVELYAFSGAQRGNAAEARAATDVLVEATKSGKLPQSAEVTPENLRQAGVPEEASETLAAASADFQKQEEALTDERLLAGFGNNGGEEYLSYLTTSESLVIAGGDGFKKWNAKMLERLEKVQSPDGSWTGHHCITSPVFCTAAVVQCLTTERDSAQLILIAQRAAGAVGRDAQKTASAE